MILNTMLGLALVATCNAATLPPYNKRPIEWLECPAFLKPNASSPLTCGYLDVPLDWDNPYRHEPVKIGFVKIPARDPKNRIGNLFYNPGGPGAPASMSLNQTLTKGSFHPEILDKFDIIGIDLRGSGLSEPIECNRTLYNERVPLYITDEESYRALVNRNRAIRQSCLEMTGRPLIDYMDTISVIKDFEAVRRALGGEKITFVGQSYGTQLGSQYAELFPDVFRAVLLDGINSISPSLTSLFVMGASASDAVLEKYFATCEQQNQTICPLAHQNQTVKAIWLDLMDRAEESPLPAPACSSPDTECTYDNVTATQIRQTVLHSLYSPYPSNAVTIAYALYNASILNDASYFAGALIGKETTRYEASYDFANTAFSCQDDAHASSPNDMKWKPLIASTQTPLMKGYAVYHGAFVRSCIGWPEPKRNPPHRIRIPESDELPPILLVTNLYDPATPNPMAMNLLYEIGEHRARLLTRNALGHTVWFREDAYEGPTVEAMNRYLVNLELPEQGAVYQN